MFSHYRLNDFYPLRSQLNKTLCEYHPELKSSEKCIRFSLPRAINGLDAETIKLFDDVNVVTFKIKLKKLLLSKYEDSSCRLVDCFACNQRLFYPRYLSVIMQHINIYAYMTNTFS